MDHCSHLLRKSVKTASKVFRCQKLSTSIICMIWEITTRSFLCRFDSRGVKPIPSIIMLLCSSTTFCLSIICSVSNDLSVQLWHIGTFCSLHSFVMVHSSYSLRYHHCLSASPLSMLSTIHFRHHHLLGPVPLLLHY